MPGESRSGFQLVHWNMRLLVLLLFLQVPIQSQIIATIIDTSAGIFSNPSLSVGPDNLPVAVYSDTLLGIRVLKCGNAECSADNTVSVLDPVEGMGYYSEVLVPPDNKPLVAFSQSDSLGGTRFLVVKCLNAACTSASKPLAVDPRDLNQVTHIDWILGSDGLPLLNFCNGSRVLVSKCLDSACSAFSVLAEIGDGKSVNCQTDPAIGKNGLPILTYLDDEGHLKVTHCGTLDCSSGNTTTTVDSAALSGFEAAIDVGGDGTPVLSFSRLSDRALYVLKCGDAECRHGNTLTKMNNQGDPIGYTDIGVGPDGLPRVAFQNLYRERLQLIVCGDPECRSIRSNSVVDSGGFKRALVFKAGQDSLPMAVTLRRSAGKSDLRSASFWVVKCLTGNCSYSESRVIRAASGKANMRNLRQAPSSDVFDFLGRWRNRGAKETVILWEGE